MARRKTSWTIVYNNENGELTSERHGDDIDSAKERLGELKDALLFPADNVPFSVGIVIGKQAAPRKRAPTTKRNTTKKPNGGGTRVDADFFERKEDDGPGATNPLDEEK